MSMMAGKMLAGACAIPVGVDSIESAHHSVALMEQKMAVVHASTYVIGKVRAKSHVSVPRNRFGLAPHRGYFPVTRLIGERIPVAAFDDDEIVDVDMEGMPLVLGGQVAVMLRSSWNSSGLKPTAAIP